MLSTQSSLFSAGCTSNWFRICIMHSNRNKNNGWNGRRPEAFQINKCVRLLVHFEHKRKRKNRTHHFFTITLNACSGTCLISCALLLFVVWQTSARVGGGEIATNATHGIGHTHHHHRSVTSASSHTVNYDVQARLHASHARIKCVAVVVTESMCHLFFRILSRL